MDLEKTPCNHVLQLGPLERMCNANKITYSFIAALLILQFPKKILNSGLPLLFIIFNHNPTPKSYYIQAKWDMKRKIGLLYLDFAMIMYATKKFKMFYDNWAHF